MSDWRSCVICNKLFLATRIDKMSCDKKCATLYSQMKKKGISPELKIKKVVDRKCQMCKEVKPIEDFYKTHKRIWSWCKECFITSKGDKVDEIFTGKDGELLREVKDFVYKIKDQKYLASEEDIIMLVSLSSEAIPDTRWSSKDNSYDRLYYRLSKWYVDKRDKMIKEL